MIDIFLFPHDFSGKPVPTFPDRALSYPGGNSMSIAEAIEDTAPVATLQSNGKDRLRAFIERIERLEEEKAALAADIREVFAEAKSTGFDTKAMRAIIRIRKQDDHERMEQEALLATYMHALGMIGSVDPD